MRYGRGCSFGNDKGNLWKLSALNNKDNGFCISRWTWTLIWEVTVECLNFDVSEDCITRSGNQIEKSIPQGTNSVDLFLSESREFHGKGRFLLDILKINTFGARLVVSWLPERRVKRNKMAKAATACLKRNLSGGQWFSSVWNYSYQMHRKGFCHRKPKTESFSLFDLFFHKFHQNRRNELNRTPGTFEIVANKFHGILLPVWLVTHQQCHYSWLERTKLVRIERTTAAQEIMCNCGRLKTAPCWLFVQERSFQKCCKSWWWALETSEAVLGFPLQFFHAVLHPIPGDCGDQSLTVIAILHER